jgi:cellulose synthase/poly-beta-1,6-N-acetylglucosamine synthase-like glycosyltransferase
MLMLKVRYEIAFTWASLVVVLGSFGLYLQTAQGAEAGWHSLETFVFVVVVALLISGNVVYHVSRLGYLYRRRTHRAASRDILEAIYDSPAPAVSILVPSYKEEARVLLQTVLSVALMEYPHRRVVVLLDDPPSRAPLSTTSLPCMRHEGSSENSMNTLQSVNSSSLASR